MVLRLHITRRGIRHIFHEPEGGVRHIFHVPKGGRSTLSSKLYKGQGLSKPTPSYDQKSISGILECYPKTNIFFALLTKSPFLNICNSNLLIKQPFNNLIYILSFIYCYTCTHSFTILLKNLNHKPHGVSIIFLIPEGGVRIFFTCFEIVRNMKAIFLLLGPLANYVIGFSNLFRQFIQSSIRNLESVAQKMAELLHNYVIIR